MPDIKKASGEDSCRTCRYFSKFENFAPEFKGTCSKRRNAPTKYSFICEEYIFQEDEEGLRVLDRAW